MAEPDRTAKLPLTALVAHQTTPRLNQLFDHFRKMENAIGAWLEVETESENPDQQALQTIETMLQFEVRTDLNRVKQLIPDHLAPEVSRAQLAWENLIPFYEAGFLMTTGKQTAHIERFFFRGVRFEIPQGGKPYPGALPPLSPLQVKKMDSQKWLAKSGFDFLQVDRDSQAFLFQPDQGVRFVLICATPSIWRDDHIRQTQLLLNNAFDPATLRAAPP